LIIGHRGASAVAPENTLAAFARALEDGADGIEFDVQLSRDDVPFVIHDATLSRTAGLARAVADASSEELAASDVGSWFNRKFPRLAQPGYEREQVPTLKDVFDLLSKSPCLIYLEMKCAGSDCERVASHCIDLIDEYSFGGRTIVECFDLAALVRVKSLNSKIRTAALFEPRLIESSALLKRIKLIDRAVDCGADEIALHHTLVSKRTVQQASKLKIPCVVWTVDHPRWYRRASELGMKALITNNPAIMVNAK
jgi:glycerophosphoryl diester phosphodiesterase